MPGRDILLRTALLLGMPLRDTQRLLAIGRCGTLYPRVRRDAAIIFALHQRMTLLETEDLLTSLPERGLYAGNADMKRRETFFTGVSGWDTGRGGAASQFEGELPPVRLPEGR